MSLGAIKTETWTYLKRLIKDKISVVKHVQKE